MEHRTKRRPSTAKNNGLCSTGSWFTDFDIFKQVQTSGSTNVQGGYSHKSENRAAPNISRIQRRFSLNHEMSQNMCQIYADANRLHLRETTPDWSKTPQITPKTSTTQKISSFLPHNKSILQTRERAQSIEYPRAQNKLQLLNNIRNHNETTMFIVNRSNLQSNNNRNNQLLKRKHSVASNIKENRNQSQQPQNGMVKKYYHYYNNNNKNATKIQNTNNNISMFSRRKSVAQNNNDVDKTITITTTDILPAAVVNNPKMLITCGNIKPISPELPSVVTKSTQRGRKVENIAAVEEKFCLHATTTTTTLVDGDDDDDDDNDGRSACSSLGESIAIAPIISNSSASTASPTAEDSHVVYVDDQSKIALFGKTGPPHLVGSLTNCNHQDTAVNDNIEHYNKKKSNNRRNKPPQSSRTLVEWRSGNNNNIQQQHYHNDKENKLQTDNTTKTTTNQQQQHHQHTVRSRSVSNLNDYLQGIPILLPHYLGSYYLGRNTSNNNNYNNKNIISNTNVDHQGEVRKHFKNISSEYQCKNPEIQTNNNLSSNCWDHFKLSRSTSSPPLSYRPNAKLSFYITSVSSANSSQQLSPTIWGFVDSSHFPNDNELFDNSRSTLCLNNFNNISRLETSSAKITITESPIIFNNANIASSEHLQSAEHSTTNISSSLSPTPILQYSSLKNTLIQVFNFIFFC